MADPYILKVVTLFDVPERFIAFPSGKIDLDDTPDALLEFHVHGIVGEEHHRFFAEAFYYDKKEGIILARQFYRHGIVEDRSLLLLAVLVFDENCFMGTRQ